MNSVYEQPLKLLLPLLPDKCEEVFIHCSYLSNSATYSAEYKLSGSSDWISVKDSSLELVYWVSSHGDETSKGEKKWTHLDLTYSLESGDVIIKYNNDPSDMMG